MRAITIGRDESCDIIINNERVSRFHASIIPEGNRYIYRDSSSNGTVINGTMIRNSDKYIQYGDQVLLAGNIPLPWNRIQSTEPTRYNGGGANDYERSYYPSAEGGSNGGGYGGVEYKTGTGLIVFGYILSIVGSLIAIILAIILISGKQTTFDGKRISKYKPSSKINGWVIIGLTILCSFVWLAVYLSL